MNSELGLSAREQEMFSAVAQTMAQFPDVERKFNLAFDHDHFPINDDEILLENNDPETRTLTTEVIHSDQKPANAIPTIWAVNAEGQKPKVKQWCCGDD